MQKLLFLLIALGLLGLGAWWFIFSQTPSSSALLEAREQIVGIWQSTEDDSAVIVFVEDGSYRDYYEGKELGEGTWQVHGPGYRDGQYGDWDLFVEKNIDGEVYGYSIYELTSDTLALSYLERGNTLSYQRVNQIPESDSVTTPSAEQIFTNDEYDLTFSHPSDWSVEEALKPRNQRALHEFVVWEDDYNQLWRGMVSVFIFDNPDQLSVRGWLDDWLAEEDAKETECRSEYGDTSPCLFLRGLITSEYETKLANEEAIRLELFQFDHTEACVYAARGNLVYGICAPTMDNPNDSNAEEHYQVAEQIRKSFVLTN